MNYELGKVKWVFFGSSEFSVYVLDELKLHDILPSLIITTPDKPKGRKLVFTPTPVKVWAKESNIEAIDPVSLKNNLDLISYLVSRNSDLFLVASYGKIIPKEIFDIPEKKTLNIHPSLLPKYRGASPIQSQILNDEKEMGVTIMQVDEGMDTGPIVIQKKITLLTPLTLRRESEEILSSSSPLLRKERGWGEVGRKDLEKLLAIEGAQLFVQILPDWLEGKIKPTAQNEKEATCCQKIEKADGLIDLNDNPYKNLLKVKAFEEWPTAYFFLNGRRIIVTDARLNPSTSSGQAKLEILKVIPEGKKEMLYQDFLRGQR